MLHIDGHVTRNDEFGSIDLINIKLHHTVTFLLQGYTTRGHNHHSWGLKFYVVQLSLPDLILEGAGRGGGGG